MNKVACAHQPDFLPHLAFFYKVVMSDIFIILDDVQFPRRGFVHRDKILNQLGDPEWLTIGIVKPAFDALINSVVLAEINEWRIKNLSQIKNAYFRHPYFDQIYPFLENIYLKNINSLLEFNMTFLNTIFGVVAIKPKVVYSSNLRVTSTSSTRLAEISHRVGATTYLSGVGAKNYLDEKAFVNNSVEVSWVDFHHPAYPQLFDKFVPGLSIVDYLMCCGFEGFGNLVNEWRVS